MQLLHIVTPSHASTTSACVGLMRLTHRHLWVGSHQVVVIGNQEDANEMRSMGLPILGFIDGIQDASRTLKSRFANMVRQFASEKHVRVVAWGWHAASVASGLPTDTEVIAFVDEVDFKLALTSRSMTIIPTSWSGVTHIKQLGVPANSITEPLVGVEPTSLVIDRNTTLEQLQLDHASCIIGIVGRACSWQEIIQMVSRLHSAGLHADYVLPVKYNHLSQLLKVSRTHGLGSVFHETPGTLRDVDVLNIVVCSWAPLNSTSEETCGVLDVIAAAWEGIPIAVSSKHSVSTVPTIGTQLAWAKDNVEISAWLTQFIKGEGVQKRGHAEVTASIREIASPSRFIEGLQMRL